MHQLPLFPAVGGPETLTISKPAGQAPKAGISHSRSWKAEKISVHVRPPAQSAPVEQRFPNPAVMADAVF